MGLGKVNKKGSENSKKWKDRGELRGGNFEEGRKRGW